MPSLSEVRDRRSGTPARGGGNPNPTEGVQPTRVGSEDQPSMPAPPDVSGNVGNVPSGVDVRDENAPQIDALQSQIDSLRGRLRNLRQRPTQQELQNAEAEADQIRNQAEQAVQTAYRLGIARALRAVRNR